jgi:hypothetical protein
MNVNIGHMASKPTLEQTLLIAVRKLRAIKKNGRADASVEDAGMSSRAVRPRLLPLRHVQAANGWPVRGSCPGEAFGFGWATGKPSVYRSSPIATRGLCADRGTSLFLRYDGDELIRLTAGSLDHPEGIRPAGHYGVESRLRWAECGPGLPEEETQERW